MNHLTMQKNCKDGATSSWSSAGAKDIRWERTPIIVSGQVNVKHSAYSLADDLSDELARLRTRLFDMHIVDLAHRIASPDEKFSICVQYYKGVEASTSAEIKVDYRLHSTSYSNNPCSFQRLQLLSNATSVARQRCQLALYASCSCQSWSCRPATTFALTAVALIRIRSSCTVGTR